MFSPMHKHRWGTNAGRKLRSEIWYCGPLHHVIPYIISGRLAQACADLGRRRKFVSDIASHTRDENRRWERRQRPALRNAESWCNLRLPCCKHPGEHKSSTRFRAHPRLKEVTRNARGLCRNDFLATRVYILDRVSDITRPYVSCVIWCWRRPRLYGQQNAREYATIHRARKSVLIKFFDQARHLLKKW